MRAAFNRVAPVILLGALPVAVLVLAAVSVHRLGNLGNDFRSELYPEAKLVLDGVNPFPAPHTDLSGGQNRIFPIPAALLVAPLTALPPMWAAAVWAVVLLALLALTLRVLGVRDWRVYGLVAMWPSTLAAVQTGNVTIPLGLLVALAWRFRARLYLPGVAIGGAIAIKLFLWPLLLWLLAIRRFGAAALGAAIGVAGGLLLVLPFTSIGRFVDLIDELRKTFGPQSYSIAGLLVQSGTASFRAAGATAAAVGLGALALACRRRSFPLTVAAALVLSPIVWLHYFVLLAVPLAVRSPRLAAAWFIPLALWACPGNGANVRERHVVVALAVLALVAVVSEVGTRRPGGGAQHEATDRELGLAVPD